VDFRKKLKITLEGMENESTTWTPCVYMCNKCLLKWP